MNPTASFRRMVFAQVMLGIVASCMAERNPGLLLVAGSIGAMSWYVTQGPRPWTLGRWGVNGGAVLAVLWLGFELTRQGSDVVSAMGHFTLALQLLMLYAPKTTREYSQLMVLSLLQIVGASVLSVSMIYGVFMAAYCVVAMLSSLLFHLVTSAEKVHHANLHAALGGPMPLRPDAVAGRSFRGQLRAAAVMIGSVCGVIAMAVFIATPRTGGSYLPAADVPGVGPKQTGFSNTIQLGTGPLGSGSREPTLNLRVLNQDQSIGWEEQPWLVRGAALDAYDPATATWYRSPFAAASDRLIRLDAFNAAHDFNPRSTYTAEVTLRDPRQRTVFSVVSPPYRRGLPGFNPVHLEAEGLDQIQLSAVDQQMQVSSSGPVASVYRMSWPMPSVRLDDGSTVNPAPLSIDELPEELLPEVHPPPPDGWGRWRRRRDRDRDRERDHDIHRVVVDRTNYAREWNVEPERVRALALQVLDAAGIERDPAARHTEQDLLAASVLAAHLRRHYAYDMSNPPPRGDADPTIVFLFQSRRGHCELFAAGLAALCRSVGIPARIITGFRASEYNTLGDYYVVRQSNAHAWTEVDGGPGVGWHTFDATPGDEVRREHAASTGFFARVRSVYEHIEFAWIKSVVAFDSRTQEKAMQSVSASFTSARTMGGGLLVTANDLLARLSNRAYLDEIEVGMIAFCGVGLAIAVLILVRIAVVRQRRIAALHLEALPPRQRRSLAKHLGFYLTMLDMLERHDYRRPCWQSPACFARELSEANPLRFGPVVALTDQFYEVRFGARELDDDRRQRVRAHLKQLELAFAERGG